MYKTQIKRAKEEENITYFIDDISQADRISQISLILQQK